MTTPEASPEDVAEQRAALTPEEAGGLADELPADELPLEASAADALEQAAEVPQDEDDHRP